MPPEARLSPGKVRGLTAAANEAGIFTILAVDHRDSMRVVLSPDAPDAIPAATLTEAKFDLIAGIADLASAVLVDPEYSAGQAVASRVLPGRTGFICAVEAQGYLGDPNARVTSLLDGWSVAKAKRLGASGVKLLVLYRPDTAIAATQDEVIAAVVAECAREEIPLFLEPVAYGKTGEAPPGSEEFAAQRRSMVVDSVKRLGPLGPDVLKLQFPVDTLFETDRAIWVDACAELAEACPVPWALLSGGDPFDLFVDQVRVACDAGASGFLVGRALWGESIALPTEQRREVIASRLRDRFARLAAVATDHGTDWAELYTAPAVDEHWFRTY
jgi:tagatose 1,6-diphosphate aldolase